MADLLGADPRGIVFGRSMTQLTFDLVPHAGRRLGPGRRGGGHPARPRREHPAVGAGRRGGRRDGALGRLRPGDRRADRGRRRRGAVRADPAGRRHRRLQPDRHPARRSPRSPRWRTTPGRCLRRRRAPHRARAGRRRRAGRGLLRLLAVQVPRPALRRAGGRAGAAGDAAPRTSCCRRPTPCPSGSSSARCPTSCWPGTTAAVDFLAGLRRPPTATPARAAGRRDDRRSRSTRTGCASTLEDGARRAARRHGCGRGPPHRTPTLLLTFDGRDAADAYRFLAERGVNAPAGLVLRDRGHPLARAWATPAACGVGLAPYSDARRRRPAARRPAGVPRPTQSMPSPGTQPAGGSGRRTTGRTLRADGEPLGVAGRVAADVRQVVVGRLAEHLGGDAADHRAGRELRARGDDGARGDDRARADVRAVHHDAAHADQDVVVDPRPVQDDAVADGDAACRSAAGSPASECSVQPSWTLEPSPISIVSASARATAPYQMLELRAHGHRAHDDRRRRHEGLVVDLRGFPKASSAM